MYYFNEFIQLCKFTNKFTIHLLTIYSLKYLLISLLIYIDGKYIDIAML